MKHFLLSTALLGTLCAASVSAQDFQRLPGVIDKPLPMTKPPADMRRSMKDQERLAPPPKLQQAEHPEKQLPIIETVSFEGVTVLNEQVLQLVSAPYLGRPLTEQDLAKLKFDIESEFYNRGYILVRAYTPPQNVSDGHLHVRIYEARVGKIEVVDNGVMQKGMAEAISEVIPTGSIFNEEVVASMVSDIDDLKDISATATLRPGKAPGTTDIIITIVEDNEDIYRVAVDNYGSKLTGQYVLSASAEHSNAFGIGETFRISGRITNEELWGVAVGVDIPLGFDNLFLEAQASYGENDIVDRLKYLNASGESFTASAALRKNFVNTDDLKISARLGFEARTHESFIAGGIPETKDDIRQVFLMADYFRRKNDLTVYSSFKLTRGINVFGASEKGDTLNTRATGEHEAFRLLPTLYANYRLHDAGFVKFLARGQVTSDTVLSSDLFTLGGYGSVRGFEPAQETGDGGFSFTTEYNHEFDVSPEWIVRAGPFVDGGMVYNRLDSVTNADQQLYAGGVGFELAGDLIEQGPTTLRVDWAHPLGHYNSPEVDDDSFYFRLAQEF